MNAPSQPETSTPSAPAVRGGRVALRSGRRLRSGAWAGSAVISLAVHAAALGTLGLLALLPNFEGGASQQAGVRLPWTESFGEVSAAEPFVAPPLPLPSELPPVDVPLDAFEPQFEGLMWPEPMRAAVTLEAFDPQQERLVPEPEVADPAEAEESPEDAAEDAAPVPPTMPPTLPAGETSDLGGESDPVLEHAPSPRYPRLARARGWEGVVEVRLSVSATGAVVDARIETSCGYPLLDDAALEAVRKWRFQPATLAGIPIERELLHRVRFQLAD